MDDNVSSAVKVSIEVDDLQELFELVQFSREVLQAHIDSVREAVDRAPRRKSTYLQMLSEFEGKADRWVKRLYQTIYGGSDGS